MCFSIVRRREITYFFSFCLRIVEKAFEGAVEIGTPYIYRRTRKHARSLVLSQNRVKKK